MRRKRFCAQGPRTTIERKREAPEVKPRGVVSIRDDGFCLREQRQPKGSTGARIKYDVRAISARRLKGPSGRRVGTLTAKAG